MFWGSNDDDVDDDDDAAYGLKKWMCMYVYMAGLTARIISIISTERKERKT